ncbi:MAG: aspartate--tRNA ligase [Patescibacteria group bacterium]
MILIDYKKINQSLIEQDITIGGFVNTIRDHGGLLFIDLRSFGQTFQTVVDPSQKEVFEIAKSLHSEYVVEIKGKISKRTPETINNKIPNGDLELLIEKLEVVSKAKTLPFDIHSENLANEDLRLKFRYIDLRRDKLQKLLIDKHNLILATRNFFSDQDFIEVQTPILANSSPEGARDYLVPSRLYPGKFYALPQAPQQFKQMLMVGGFNKYFQIAACFRDEDPRSDRHPGDFYQVDAELAWAKEKDIFDFSWKYISEVIVKYTNKTLFPELVELPYDSAMEHYGSDKPDLRFYQNSQIEHIDNLGWLDVKDVFSNSGFAVFDNLQGQSNSRVQALNIKGGAEKFTRSDLDKIQDLGRSFGLPGIAYFQYMPDGVKSPLLKFFTSQEDILQKLQTKLGIETNDLVLFLASENKDLVFKAQNSIRKHVASKMDLIKKDEVKFIWINRMPFYSKDEKTGKLDFEHNPFGVFQNFEGLDAMQTLEEAVKSDRLLELRGIQYDIACNGYEVLSGGMRNSNPELLMKAFQIAGYTEEQVKSNFGHMMEAYSYGAPYHAGFAWGLDRMFMVLNDEENIREVIAFPKNGQGKDLLMNSPSEVRPSQLKELHIKIIED